MRSNNWRGKVVNALKERREASVIYPTPHQRKNVPQGRLRCVLSQGRSPYASDSSKNASDPIGIPLFEAPQAPRDKPNPSGGGTAYRMRSNNWRGKVMNAPKERRETSEFTLRRSLVYINGWQHHFCRGRK